MQGDSASSLGGTFTKMGTFAAKSNVTFTGTAWTSDISHGDCRRELDQLPRALVVVRLAA